MANASKDKWFVSVSGDLCNGEAVNCPVVRKAYSRHYLEITKPRELAASLRAGEYAWPGGYRLAFVTDDGELLCFRCARENFAQIARAIKDRTDNGWRVVAVLNTGETDPDEAAHCWDEIVPAAE